MYSKEHKQKIKTDFWQLFGIQSKYHLSKVDKSAWILYNTKIKGVELKFDIQPTWVAVVLEINHKDEMRRIEIFEILHNQRAVFDEHFPSPLEWDLVYERGNGVNVSRIYITKENADWQKQQQWQMIFDFLIQNMLRMENCFDEVQELISE